MNELLFSTPFIINLPTNYGKSIKICEKIRHNFWKATLATSGDGRKRRTRDLFFQLQILVFHFRPVTYKADLKGTYVVNKGTFASKWIWFYDLGNEVNNIFDFAKNHMTI